MADDPLAGRRGGFLLLSRHHELGERGGRLAVASVAGLENHAASRYRAVPLPFGERSELGLARIGAVQSFCPPDWFCFPTRSGGIGVPERAQAKYFLAFFSSSSGQRFFPFRILARKE
mgnify:CR=1 FL=1